MRPRASLADFAALVTRPIVRRGAWLVAIAVVERTLAPVIAWTLFQRKFEDKIVISVLFGAVVTMRSLVQRIATARTEAELLERTAASVLEGDVLRAEVLSDQDLRLEAAQAVYHVSQTFAQTLPNGVGDGVACVLLAAAVAFVEPARLVVIAAVMTIAAAGALLVSRRAVGRAAERA